MWGSPLNNVIQNLINTLKIVRVPSVVTIQAPAGIGKSSMLKYILKVFFLSLPKFQISGTCALSGARMNSGPRTLRSWSSLSVGHSTTSGRWHAGFFPLRSKLFKVYYNVPHTQLKWFAGNSSANMSRASPPRLIQSLTLWRKSRDRWKVQNLLWPFPIERLRLGACSSCWTALMRSQEWLHSPGSFPPSLNVSCISLTPFKLEPKVQQWRHPHSPPVDPGDTKHNSLKSPCWSSGNLGWPTSSRSSCHCNEQTPHSDLPPGIILPVKERGVGYIP